MLTSYLIYTKDTAAMAAFYHQNFRFNALQEQGDRIVELLPSDSGPSIMLHPLAHGRKDGQTLVKLIFWRARCRRLLHPGASKQFGIWTRSQGQWL